MISVCMIVWNEEDLLPVAVASTEGLADEVVVVDTGSCDNTVEVARQLGVVVIEGADRMHKGAARNTAIESAKGDWVVILDADERIADPIGLRSFLETTDAQAVYVKLAFMDANDRQTLSYQQMRCWRHGTYLYKYRAHEVPTPSAGWGKIEHTSFVWEHRPPPDRAWKSQYTLDRLLLDMKDNPGDPRPVYYLGRQYMYRSEWEKGAEYLEYYLETPGRDEPDAWWDLSKCYAGMNDEKGRIKALHQACAAEPGRREWWCGLASLYHKKGQYGIAAGLLKCALEMPTPERTYINHYWYGANTPDLLARCLWKLQRYEEGKGYAEQALALDPDNERLKTNLLWFESQLGDMDAFYRLYGAGIHSGCGRHEAIAQLVEGPRVLDVGCGTGDLLLMLQDRDGYELCGTDISQVALDMARERGFKGELRRTIPEWAFNTIVMAQVVEHVPDDRQFVLDAADKLVPKGKLIVTVPHDGRIPSPDHKRDYSVESLRALLSEIGEPILHSWPGERDRILMSVRYEPASR